MFGSDGVGLTTTFNQYLYEGKSQIDGGVNGNYEVNDRFGAALAAGNFDHNAFADLAVGVPGENDEVGYIQLK